MLRIADNRRHRPPGCRRPGYHFFQPGCGAIDRASHRRSSVPMTNEMTIGEVPVVPGVTASAIRYHERRQRQGGKRLFETAVVHRLSLIARVQPVGSTARRSTKLLIDDTDRPRPRLVDEKIVESRERSDRLAAMMGLLEEARRRWPEVLASCLIDPTVAESDPEC